MVRQGAHIFFILLTGLFAPASLAASLLISGTIYTADDTHKVVEAVVIEDGRFSYVGDLVTARSKVETGHQHIALGEATAYPGFIESHGHLSSLGEAITNLDLNGVDSYQTIVGMVADAAAKASPGQVIKGRGWHQSKWSKQPSVIIDGFPTHRSLSEVSPNNPVFLGHANGHTGTG